MEKKITKDDLEWTIFREVYSYYERFAIPEERDEYWQELIKDGKELVKKYNHDTFCVRLVSAIMASLDDKIKGAK